MTIKCSRCDSVFSDDIRFCRNCGARLKPSRPDETTLTMVSPVKELTRGTVFAERYHVIEELGQGGMGRVYRVLDTHINEEVALKVLRPEIASDQRIIKRFRNELKMSRQVTHKNVCRIYHLGEDEGSYYITMEYIQGEDLKSMLKMTWQFSTGTAVTIAKQMCDGLGEAHKLGVIHRDLKPGNIMIDREGQVRILDFGLARSFDLEGDTETELITGTPEYMSPEQAAGEEEDLRSDIYSLGVILYEMVTGKAPFTSESLVDIAAKHKKETPKNPKTVNPHLPDKLVRIIMKCLAKDKEKRFQDTDELLAALKESEEEIHKDRASSKTKTGTRKKDRRVSLWVVYISLLLIAGLAVIGFLLFRGQGPSPPDEQKMLAVLPFANLGPSEHEYFVDGVTEEIRNRLAALHMLRVISRTSAIQYKNTEKPIQRIAQELGVDYVLEGSVRWDKSPEGDGRIRVNSQLVRSSDDTYLWSGSFDRVMGDLFSVQSEIAEQVTQQLDLVVLEPERRALNARPTDNLEAYDYYLQGREHEDRGWAYQDNHEFAIAIDLLEKATALDPNFTLAYTRQSYIHSRMYFFSVDRTEERKNKSFQAISKAVELEPDLPEVQRILAFYYYWCMSDYDRAAEVFESVQRAAPNYDAQVLGYIQRRQGKWEEAVETLQRSFLVNPRDTQIAYELGGATLSMHRYSEAEQWFNRTLSLYPDHLPAQLGKIAITVQAEGNILKAKAAAAALPEHQLKDQMEITLLMLERNYNALINRISSLPYDIYKDQHFYFQKDLALASVYYAVQDTASMQTHADKARVLLEKAAEDNLEDPRYHAALGLAYAYLDRNQEGIEEGMQAAGLHSVEKDAAQGPIYLLNLARIYTITGDQEEAIDRLEYLLSVPHAEYLWQLISVPQLRFDPQWNALRDNPRFVRLTAEEPAEVK